MVGLKKSPRGKVSVDDKAIDCLLDSNLRVYYCPQTPKFFRESIIYNLTLGSSISENRVWDALECVQLASEVRSFPKALHSVIGSDISLSGGQSQRLGLARMLLSDAQILFMDDCLTALDYDTQKLVVKQIIYRNRSAIFVIATNQNSFDRYANVTLRLDENH